jgi:hypothetical protein
MQSARWSDAEPLPDVLIWGQTRRHSPHPKQRFSMTTNSRSGQMPSGLWHHAHRNGQPFRNTVVRMPGPSCIEYL